MSMPLFAMNLYQPTLKCLQYMKDTQHFNNHLQTSLFMGKSIIPY